MLESLDLDEKDLRIMSLYMQTPDISQTEISKILNLTQPSVNFRIQKLVKRGILSFDVGMSFKKTKLFVARVDFTAKNPNFILEKLKKCSFFINGFIMSGKNNVSILVVNNDLRKIDDIINQHIRVEPDVSDINVNILISSANDFLLRLNLDGGHLPEQCKSPGLCAECIKIGKPQAFKPLLNIKQD